MSTRNNKGGYKSKSAEEISAETYIPQELKEKFNTPEARKEAIEKLVEEDARTFDAQEEKFLESSVAEIETQPVNEAEEPCTCDENCVCEDQVCTDPACTCEKSEDIKETLEKYHNVDAEEEIRKMMEAEAPKPFHHEFQDEYHFGPGNGDAVIDTLPEPVKAPERKKKTFAQMTACEMNIYNKTGIIPFE